MGVLTVPRRESENRRQVERQYLKYAAVGTQFGLTITLFTLAGVWLDERFDKSPLFTIILALFGIVGGMIALVYKVK